MIPTLYVVATPIGNLSDITFRAVEILKSVDCIAAEDTRHSRRLMDFHNIPTSLISYHEFGGEYQLNQVLNRLKNGESVALISDAGTPLISDPGYKLVTQAKEENIKVVPVPGPSAVITALSVAGLPTDEFSFHGFLPSKQKARKDVLTAFIESPVTAVFYEAPHRILVCLQDMRDLFGGERKVCLVRELTKTFETIELKTLDELCEWVEGDLNQQKGEMVVVVSGVKARVEETLSDSAKALAVSLFEHMPPKIVSKLVAEHKNVSKKDVYQFLLSLKSS
ncbi:MAG: 16S rRNA (cytidine(1402)-2'-O)-methyltransferase [Sinobacterium sp.]|nr:16S rRNA (cytidine(1402)-2'-O)-methyltransferase [Sinobacterium sp.]